MPASVAFCAYWRAKEDEILQGEYMFDKRAYLSRAGSTHLCDGGVDDVHRSHCACDAKLNQHHFFTSLSPTLYHRH